MKKDDRLVQMVCRPYCGYYKPGKNEELLCRGAVMVKQLTAAGRLADTWALPVEIDRTLSDEVAMHVCRTCDFREQDCDFTQDRTAQPCGGFILITQLLGSGLISIEDLQTS